MNNKKVINIMSNERVYDINGAEYKVVLSDKKIESILSFINKIDDNVTDADKQLEIVKELFDVLFGDNAGNTLYNSLGKNSVILIDVAFQVFEDLTDVITDFKNKRVNKYLK